MTPPAMTAAGRGGNTATTPKPTAAPGHRRGLRKPQVPRRVSGPVGGSAGSATTPRPSRRPKPAAPRRGRRLKTIARPRSSAGLAARASAFIRSLPDHSLLDRVVRGRAWIPLLGILLAGIVAMQVEVLKLGASIGRSLERSTALEGRNELLRANVAALADDQRIMRLAAKMGMIMPGPDQVGFLADAPTGNLARATANIHAPDPSGFASNAGVVTVASAMASTGMSPTGTTQGSTTPSGSASSSNASSTQSSASTASTTTTQDSTQTQSGSSGG